MMIFKHDAGPCAMSVLADTKASDDKILDFCNEHNPVPAREWRKVVRQEKPHSAFFTAANQPFDVGDRQTRFVVLH